MKKRRIFCVRIILSNIIYINKESNNNKNNNYNYNNYNYYQKKKTNTIIPKSFLFSLNNNQIYYMENFDNIICFNNKCTNEGNKCLINICNNNLLITEKNKEYLLNVKDISNGEKTESNKYLNIQEIELFQISYNN